MVRDLLARARLAGYRGGKTAFYALVASTRHAMDEGAQSIVPGEMSHHDVGEVDLRFATGNARRLHFLVSRLAYSGWISVSLLAHDGVEPVARALVDAFAAMGGVPLLARFERPKPLADTYDERGKPLSFNPTFAYLAAELGVGFEARKPRDLSRRLKDEFFRTTTFVDLADLIARLGEFCVDHNRRAPDGDAFASPELLLAEEKRKLRPLAVTAACLELREASVVGADGVVVHQNGRFTMPIATAGKLATIYWGRDRVRIVAGGIEVVTTRAVG